MPRLSEVYKPTGVDTRPLAAVNPEDNAIESAVAQAEQVSKIENINNDIEELHEVVSSLEAISKAISDERDTGLSVSSAVIVKKLVQSQSAKAGFTQNVIPSLECFNGYQARLHTTITVESLDERIKDVWEKIKAMMEKMYQSFMEYLKHVDVVGESMIKRFEALKERVSGISGETAGEIDLGEDLAKRLVVNGAIPAGLSGLKEAERAVSAVHGAYQFDILLLKIFTAASADFYAAKTDADLQASFKKLFDLAQPTPSSMFANVSEKDGSKIAVTHVLPGNVTLELTTAIVDPKTFDDPVDYAAALCWPGRLVKHTDESAHELKTTKAKALTIHEIEDAAAVFKDLMETSDMAKRHVTESQKTVQEEQAHLYKLTTQNIHGLSSESVRRATRLFSSGMNGHRLNLTNQLRATQAAVTVAGAYLKYAELSTKFHEGK